MVLVDTTEATPKEMLDKLEKFLEDEFSGFATSAVSTVLKADNYDYDGSDGMELIDELGDLQEAILAAKV